MNTTNELSKKVHARLSLSVDTIPPNWKKYLEAHINDPVGFREHLETAAAYEPYVKGLTLDWGCMQGTDSIYLNERGHQVEQCDIVSGDWYAPTRSGIPYKVLDHAWNLPYADERFETVIGSGVLEHVPNVHESLTELWRIMKPGGNLIITHAPQRLSAIEFVLRITKPPYSHQRRFSWSELYTLLNQHGFKVVLMRCHAPTPILCSFRTKLTLFIRSMFPKWIQNIPVARLFTQNLMAVAVKQVSI
jgi:2-polyprenyl-3-methyl-5-hydroxy-6-metoxy-1,4-benzoquinol methylase